MPPSTRARCHRPLLPYPPFQPNRHSNLPEPFFRPTRESRRDRLIRYQNRCLASSTTCRPDPLLHYESSPPARQLSKRAWHGAGHRTWAEPLSINIRNARTTSLLRGAAGVSRGARACGGPAAPLSRRGPHPVPGVPRGAPAGCRPPAPGGPPRPRVGHLMSPPAAVRPAIGPAPHRTRRNGGLCPPWRSPVPPGGLVAPALPCPPRLR
jgi:hypothetical protein